MFRREANSSGGDTNLVSEFRNVPCARKSRGLLFRHTNCLHQLPPPQTYCLHQLPPPHTYFTPQRLWRGIFAFHRLVKEPKSVQTENSLSTNAGECTYFAVISLDFFIEARRFLHLTLAFVTREKDQPTHTSCTTPLALPILSTFY